MQAGMFYVTEWDGMLIRAPGSLAYRGSALRKYRQQIELTLPKML